MAAGVQVKGDEVESSDWTEFEYQHAATCHLLIGSYFVGSKRGESRYIGDARVGFTLWPI